MIYDVTVSHALGLSSAEGLPSQVQEFNQILEIAQKLNKVQEAELLHSVGLGQQITRVWDGLTEHILQLTQTVSFEKARLISQSLAFSHIPSAQIDFTRAVQDVIALAGYSLGYIVPWVEQGTTGTKTAFVINLYSGDLTFETLTLDQLEALTEEMLEALPP